MVGIAVTVLLSVMGQIADAGHSIMDGVTGHHGTDAGGGEGVSLLSPLGLTVMVTGFGAFGLITRNAFGVPPLPSVFWAAGLAVLLNAAVSYLVLRLFVRSQSSSVVQSSDLVGIEAEVVSVIPVGGTGQVVYNTRTGRQTAIAMSDGGHAIQTGAFVRIDRFVGSTAVVRPLNESSKSSKETPHE